MATTPVAPVGREKVARELLTSLAQVEAEWCCLPSFGREEEMYGLLKDHLERQGYETVVDSPRGSGVKFKSLKGWTMDVVGLKENGEREVVAVEVKNDMDSSSVLDALSKAEMYRSVCSKVYVAFPRIERESKENEVVLGEVRQECRRRGIGVLLVGDKVETADPPTLSSLRPGMQQDVISQLEIRRSKFDGFRLEDFARYHRRSEEDVLWHKFSLLRDEVKARLEKQGLHLVREARGNSWWFSFSRRLPEAARYWHYPHFSVSFWGESVVIELIIREGRYLRNLRKQAEQDFEQFLDLLKDLKAVDCEAKVDDRFYIGGYETEEGRSYKIVSKYLDKPSVETLVRFLTDGRSKKWLYIRHEFDLGEDIAQSPQLVDEIEKIVWKFKPIYDLAWGD